MNELLKQSLIEIIQSNVKTEGKSVDMNTNLSKDMGFDSIDLMEMITKIEEKHAFTFDFEELDYERIIEFKGLLDIIERKAVS